MSIEAHIALERIHETIKARWQDHDIDQLTALGALAEVISIADKLSYPDEELAHWKAHGGKWR